MLAFERTYTHAHPTMSHLNLKSHSFSRLAMSILLFCFHFLIKALYTSGRMWGFTPLVSNCFRPPHPEPLARPPRPRPLPLGADEDETAFAVFFFKAIFLSSAEKSPWVFFSKEEETVELSESELPSPLLFLTEFEPSFDSLAFLFLVVDDVLSGISSSSSISASGLLPSLYSCCFDLLAGRLVRHILNLVHIITLTSQWP